MNPLIALAEHLQRMEPHALGFLPMSAYHHAARRGTIQPIRLSRGRPVGFLLHGPPRPGSFVRIYQIAVTPDHRREYHGTHKLRDLQNLAEKHGTDWITLRCADDLPALEFWRSVGALELCTRPGSKRTGRTLIELAIPCTIDAITGACPPPPPPRRLDPRIPSKIAEWLSIEGQTPTIQTKKNANPIKIGLGIRQ